MRKTPVSNKELGEALAKWMNIDTGETVCCYATSRARILDSQGFRDMNYTIEPQEWAWKSFPKDAKKILSYHFHLDSQPILDAICKLNDAGLDGRLRRCANCKEWFYAGRKDQWCCKTRCQEAYSRFKNPEFRAKNAKRMQDYRQRLKDNPNLRTRDQREAIKQLAERARRKSRDGLQLHQGKT
jgi:hypothetical protein